MQKYCISINGCDDSTLVEMELDETGFSVVLELAKLSHKNSTYGCMPTIDIEGHEIEDEVSLGS